MVASAPARKLFSGFTRFIGEWIGVIFGLLAVIAVLGVVIGIPIYAVDQNERGYWAGYNQNNGETVVSKALVTKYGQNFALSLKYANPTELKTYFSNGLVGTTTQVREYHLIGNKGVHWCVDVWYTSKDNSLIKKNCSFK